MAFETLIDVPALARLARPGPVLFDCRFELADPAAGRRAYWQGHLANAYYLDLEHDLSGPAGPATGRHPLPEANVLAERLGALGVGPDSQVVCYDDGNGAFAARAWWLLRWLGHANVAVLDGGLAAWRAAGQVLVTESPPPQGRAFVIRPALTATIDMDTVLRDLPMPKHRLVDARTPERFRGDLEAVDPVAGHIPGAMNRPFTDNLTDGRFKPAGLLANEWRTLLDGQAAHDLVAYCGSGVTACHHLLALAHAGLHGARLYPGSWSEWCRDPARPVACGV